MKLTYEQMRMLAQLGPSNDRIVLKNKTGRLLKPPMSKWHQSLAVASSLGCAKGTQYTCMGAPQKPSHAPMESRSPTSPPASSLQLPLRRGKR